MIKNAKKTLLAATLSSFLLGGCSSSSSVSTTGDDTDTSGQIKVGSITIANYQSVLDNGFKALGRFTEATDSISIDGEETDLLDVASCDSGTVTPTETLTSASVVFANCVVGSANYDGSISLVANNLSGGFLLDPPVGDGNLKATVTFTDLTVNTPQTEIENLDGDVVFDLTIAQSNSTAEISSSGLVFGFTENGAKQMFELSSLLFKFSEIAATSEEIEDVDFSYKQTLDGQVVTIKFDTTTPFRTAENADNPYAGAMTITSSEGGSIKITANDDDPDTARLEVAGAGGGILDEDTPWSEISGN